MAAEPTTTSAAPRSRGSDVQGRIVVRDIRKSFGGATAVDGLSFVVEPGCVTGFLGPNGSGKTTTLRIILGLVAPDAGTATVSGRPYGQLDRPSSEVGAVLEASSFHPARTARDHLRIYCRASGYPERRADEVLEAVELSAAARRAVGGFSLGMRQRLALATALLGDPRVVILDEPANGLDPAGIVWLRGLLRDLAAQGRTVLVSSHFLTEVDRLADRVLVIDRGRLVHDDDGTPARAGTDLEELFLRLTSSGSLSEPTREASA